MTRVKHLAVIFAAALLLIPVVPLGAQTPEIYDIVIMNGKIVDGTGNPWFYGDVAIRGDKIVKVGHIGPSRAKQRIDAKGMIVAPGFIDMLGQSETSLLIDPRAQSKIFQGITTEITGEGGSIAPVNDYILKQQEPFLNHYHLKCDWRTLGQYFDRLQRSGTAINLATYVGAAQVRQYVLHDDNRPPTEAELKQMKELVAQAMRDGAVGISTALIYAPGYYAKTDELIELAKVAAHYGGVYATHMRNEGDSEMQAMDEAFRIGKEANIPVEIFHIKVSGKQNWGKMKDVIARIEAARAAGQDVTADQYPYTAGGTSLGAVIPPWHHEGGDKDLIAKLKDPASREKIKQEIRTPSDKWENLYVDVGGGDGILIGNVLNRSLAKYEGKRISEVAKMMGKSDELDALLDLVIADDDQTGAIFFMASEDDVQYALKQSFIGVGIDHQEVNLDGPTAEGNAHPRGYGSFPRILGHYVRDEHLLTMEQAIRKMTSLAANRVHLTNRGMLKPGYFADVVVFDPNNIHDVATYKNPNRLSVGMRDVLVNGQFVVVNGEETKALPGRPLRGQGYIEKK